MGILDSLFSDNPNDAAYLALASGLLSGKGNFSSILGNSLAGAQGVYSQAKEAGQKNQLTKMQIEEMARRLKQQEQASADQQAFKQAIPAPTALGGVDWTGAQKGPTPERAQQVQPLDPNAVLQYQAMKFNQLSPLDYMKLQQKDNSPIISKPGDVARDRGGKLLWSNPDKPDITADQKDYAAAIAQGYKGNFIDYQREMANLKAPKTSVEVNTGQKGFDNTLKLRSDFRSEPVYKAHQEMQSAYSQIQQSLKQNSAAGDLAGATKIMKLLDPGSVVRESELGMAVAATGMLDRIMNYAQRIKTGELLNPQQRIEFQRLADALYSESVKQYNAKRTEYKGIVDRNGLNESDVLGSETKSPRMVKRTGTLNGRKVVEYSDGSIEYKD